MNSVQLVENDQIGMACSALLSGPSRVATLIHFRRRSTEAESLDFNEYNFIQHCF